jgi:hypothetical protein
MVEVIALMVVLDTLGEGASRRRAATMRRIDTSPRLCRNDLQAIATTTMSREVLRLPAIRAQCDVRSASV